jgi:class 3 adenylate cyclase/pimeloyl-ACP methyl ester carboxylesterase
MRDILGCLGPTIPGVKMQRRLVAILAADVVGYSRLMGAREEATLSTLKAIRHEILDAKIAEHHGRIFKTTGDGLLVEFASVVDAVNSSIAIQRAMAKRNRGLSFDERFEYRIGVNIGDVIEEAGDLYGDGVNVAARLEGIAESGGICISRQVLEQVEGKIEVACRGLGRKSLKNITKPVDAFGINLEEEAASARFLADSDLKQEVSYCAAPDGVRLAFATVGDGMPLLKSAHYLSHLEYDWELPIHREFLLALAKDYSLTRYDARGNGLSDWDVGEISLDAWVSDMEAVVDAAGLEKFVLLGLSQGVAVSIAYAVKHPERPVEAGSGRSSGRCGSHRSRRGYRTFRRHRRASPDRAGHRDQRKRGYRRLGPRICRYRTLATSRPIHLRRARSQDLAYRSRRARHRRRRLRSFPCTEDRYGRRRALLESRKRGPAAFQVADHARDARRHARRPATGHPRPR